MRSSLLTLGCLTLLLSGCGFTSSTSSAPSATHLILQGRVHGGNQPVSGASIQLFAAGANGYGTGAVSLLTKPVYTDGQGSFTLTGDYTCPTQNSQLYLVATGGNPGLAAGTNNAALELMAALGSCQRINGNYTLDPNLFINLNEVTTVAAAYALSGFFSADASQLGTSSTNAVGLSNAFLTTTNIVDLTSGDALAQTPANTGTVPQARINTLADILSACVNSDGSGTPCASLFAAATPPSGPAPTNTLQAALDVAQNPANNVTTLYNIASATPPFQPVLTAAPNDWTLTVVFPAQVLPTGAALDAEGNLWVASNGLLKYSNRGDLLATSSGYTGGPGLAIDPTGNVWATSGNNLYKFSSSGTLLSPANGYPDPGVNPAIDGFGNVWTDTEYHLYKFDNNGNQLSSPYYTGGGLVSPSQISIDGAENVWSAEPDEEVFTGGGNQTGYNGLISEFTNAGVPLSPAAGFSTNSTYYAMYIANDSFGNAWTVSRSLSSPPTAVTKIARDGTFLSGTNGFQDPSLAFPFQIAIDGNDHVWTVSTFATTGALIELDNSGKFLSGPTGFTLSAGIPTSALAIDSSGNIWLISGSIEETIGAATPTTTPLSLAVKNNTLGQRP